MPNHCDDGLDDRCRDKDGTIREKRSDTLVRTLRQTYGEEFAHGFRSDATLGTLRDRTGKSLSQLVHGKKKR